MKATQVFATLVALFATTAVAIPTVANPQLQARDASVTCDLLSWSPFSGAICASHCILDGYKGGYCDSGEFFHGHLRSLGY
jgi:hypothetical protein